MTLIDDIARMEVESKFRIKEITEISLREAAESKQIEGKIVLDPKLDPDPYGYHGVSLVDRLRAMGWP